MLTDIIATLRMLVEINLFALMGQGVLSMLPGVDREKNFFYLILRTIASPAMRLARWIAPKFVVDRHIGWIALFILLVLWVSLAVVKQITMAVEAG
ncbi:MAG: hypothetical protein EPN19_16995 [Betaproteobacteria bacterium]|nr:MAG: hypothetical protein EPN19_16995 [Betaproteobacteria bacterium]